MRTLWQWLEIGVGRGLWMLFVFVAKQSPAWTFPLVFGILIDWVTGEGALSGRGVIIAVVIQLVLLSTNIPLHTYYISQLSRLTRRLEVRLRRALVTRLQQLSIRYYDDHDSGRLQTKVLRDVEQVQLTSHQMGEIALMAVTSTIVLMGITVFKEPLVLLVYLVLVPVSLFLTTFFRGRIRPINQSFRESMEAMNAEVSQMIDMIPMSRAHGVEDKATRRVDRKFAHVRLRGKHLDRINALFQSSSWVTFQTVNLLMLGIGVTLAQRGIITIGDVVLFQALFNQMLMSVTMLINLYPQLAKGMESVRSIGEVLECPDLEHNQGKRVVAAVKGDIRFAEVDFSYPSADTAAIRDFSLHIRAGEQVAFVGPSGSGKSTIVRLAIGFRRPSSGRILLDGENMEELDMRTWRRFISVVPQEAVLFDGTIRENILFGQNDIGEDRLEEILTASNVHEFIARLPQGLDTPVGESGARLSGGQRQRLAIARALVRDPRIILLDEPTSALDVVSEKLVQEAIERLVRGRTTIIVAHRLSTIRNADRVVVMENGRMVECGSFDELAERPDSAFRRMKDLQT